MPSRLLPAILLIGTVLFPGTLHAAERNRPGLSLSGTFDLYVKAIEVSDIEALFSTVTKEEKIPFITGTGMRLGSRNGYHRFHAEGLEETG